MKNYWQEVKLGDICEYSRNRISISEVNLCNYVSTENLLKERAGKTIADSIPEQANLCEYNKGCTLISNIRPYFKKIWFANTRGGCSNDVLVYKPNNGINDKWLYYLLSQDSFFDFVMSGTKGTKMPRGDKSQIMKFPVALPPLDEQRKIAGVLSALDDKIELNNKINRNLEAQAQAIFKSWFIDFEPFKNGKFIDSELGKIPEGWKVYRLSELCEIITKGTTPTTLKRSFKNKGINFIKAENISNNHLIDKTKLAFIDIQTHELLSRSQLKPFDILFTIAGTIGRFAIVLPDIIPANTNQAIAIIRCKDIYTLLVYSMFLCGNHLTYFNSKVVQAVQANLSLSTIGSLPMLLPPKAVVERYISIVYPLFKLTFDNSDESSHLAQLRNALLPKLMTGKVNISDILV